MSEYPYRPTAFDQRLDPGDVCPVCHKEYIRVGPDDVETLRKASWFGGISTLVGYVPAGISAAFVRCEDCGLQLKARHSDAWKARVLDDCDRLGGELAYSDGWDGDACPTLPDALRSYREMLPDFECDHGPIPLSFRAACIRAMHAGRVATHRELRGDL